MKVLVTGGAGFLGINLCRYFLAKGYQVRSLDIVDFNYPEKTQVEVVTGDIRDEELVNKAIEGIDIVVHCAAALPLYTRDEIYTTDVIGTKTILDTAYRNKVHQVIHISSTTVYGLPDYHPLYEEDSLNGVGPYGEAKVAAEQVCKHYRKKGMCITIIRPKSFIGPERLGVFAIYYDWVINGKNVPIVGSGNNRYQLLDVKDLCDAIHLTTTLPKDQVNDVFNIGAKEFTTMREDFGAVLAVAGFGKKLVPIPSKLLILLLRILEILGLSPLYKWIYETASKDSFVSIEKAEKVLGFKSKYSTKDTLVRTFLWYARNYKKYQNITGVSHRAPWKQGILGIAKIFF